MSLNKTYTLEKGIWTENDFELMGWHDSLIYGLAFLTENEESQSDMLFDIDYIFEWINPVPPAKHFTFQVAPCTLIFKNISDLTIDIETGRLWQIELEIADLNREIKENPDTTQWTIETQRGDIKFEATGFTQFVRQHPKHITGQQLGITERGGISFDKKEIV